MLTLFLSLHALGGPIPMPSRAPMRYKIVSKTTTEVDLSAMGAPSQNVVLTVAGFVSVTMTDTAGGKIATITVDSSTFDAGEMTAMMPAEMTASSRGTVFHVYLVNGRPNAPVTGAPASVQGAQLVLGIELLLTGMHPSRMSESWVDTTKSDTTMAEGSATTTRVTTWTAKAGTNGRVQLDGAYTGTTTVGAGPMKMEMQLTGTARVTAMPGTLSETATSTANGAANMNMAGQSIPMKVTMEVTTSATP